MSSSVVVVSNVLTESSVIETTWKRWTVPSNWARKARCERSGDHTPSMNPNWENLPM